jgi:predicted phosphodiesterase
MIVAAARSGIATTARGGIVVAGDPHGNFSPILRDCAAREPGTLILLGDCELRVPLRQQLAPLFAAGWAVRWILGNKDAETDAVYDRLTVDFPEGDIGGKIIEIAGLRIAGLGGVFKPRIWCPSGNGAEPPSFGTRAEFLASLDPREHWRGGLPLWHRDSIFPEDFARLEQQRFDVLIAHEAPSSHRHGFAAIDRLAEAAKARLIVHGHHHESYAKTLANGIDVRGLAVAETWALEMTTPSRTTRAGVAGRTNVGVEQ